jgi:hypothetical protein
VAFPNVVRSLDGVPISQVYVPGDTFRAMAGSTATNTDGGGNISTSGMISQAGVDITILASAARTTTQTSADFINFDGRGIKVVLDMTLVGTGSVTLTIQGKDVVSGKYYTLLAGAAVITNSTNVYTVFPSATAAANVTANDMLPHTWRVTVTANNANTATYSVGASTLL